MGKILRISDKLLLTMALLEDWFENLADAGGLVSFSYQQVYGFVPRKYKRHNFYVLVKRLLKTEYLEKVVRGGEVYLRLGQEGRRKIERLFPLSKLSRQKWDGRLRVVIFDIAEMVRHRRDLLRRKLKELGFGMWQRSVWVTPLPLEEDFKEFLKSKGLFGQVHLLSCRPETIEDLKAFAQKVWRLKELNQKYQKMIEEIKKIVASQPLSFSQIERIKEEFLALSLEDPFLPWEFLPSDWQGSKARAWFKRLVTKAERERGRGRKR